MGNLRRFPWPISLFWVLIGLFLFWAKFDGPDFYHYEQWADAFRSSDITKISSDIASPLGVPLSQWSFGPGLIFALAKKSPHTPPHLSPSLIVGWVAALILWLSLAFWLWQITKNWQLTLLGLSIGVIGTLLGFYSVGIASETFSCAFLGLIGVSILFKKSWQLVDSLMVGMLSAFLIITRPQLSLYLLPFFIVLAHRWFKISMKWSRLILHLVIIGIPLIIGTLQVIVTNRWMTGSLWKFPYVFGDDVFKSIDLAHPEIAAILFHPWHGLLVYHPFYALAFLALIIMIFEKRPPIERWFLVFFLIAFAAHVYLQASWYAWWLGTWTFGMRGLALSSVIFIPLFIKFLIERKEKGQPILIWVTVLLVMTLWSFGLLWQHVTQFYTYSEVLRAQVSSLLHFLSLPRVYWSLALAANISFFLFRSRRENPDLWASIMSTFLWVLALLWLYELSSSRPVTLQKIPTSIRNSLIIFIAGLIPLIVKSIGPSPNISEKFLLYGSRISQIGLRTIILGSFIGTSVLFILLVWPTEKLISHRFENPLPMKYQSTIRLDEVEASFGEYQRVSGFEAKKRALRQFLDRAWKEAEKSREKTDSQLK